MKIPNDRNSSDRNPSNRAKKGDYLMQDDITGAVHYRSEMRKQWDGLWTHKSEWMPKSPVLFKPRRIHDMKPVRPVRVRSADVNDVLLGNNEFASDYWQNLLFYWNFTDWNPASYHERTWDEL